MEITLYPRSFTVSPGAVATAQGPVDVMVVTVLDAGGMAVRVTFGAEDWAGFQAFVADWEAAGKAASARAQILAPGGLSRTVKEPKH